MDVSLISAKERKQARKGLLKKIESYNKQLKKTRRPSFPLSSPSKVEHSTSMVAYCPSVSVNTKGGGAGAISVTYRDLLDIVLRYYRNQCAGTKGVGLKLYCNTETS